MRDGRSSLARIEGGGQAYTGGDWELVRRAGIDVDGCTYANVTSRERKARNHRGRDVELAVELMLGSITRRNVLGISRPPHCEDFPLKVWFP